MKGTPAVNFQKNPYVDRWGQTYYYLCMKCAKMIPPFVERVQNYYMDSIGCYICHGHKHYFWYSFINIPDFVIEDIRLVYALEKP